MLSYIKLFKARQRLALFTYCRTINCYTHYYYSSYLVAALLIIVIVNYACIAKDSKQMRVLVCNAPKITFINNEYILMFYSLRFGIVELNYSNFWKSFP